MADNPRERYINQIFDETFDNVTLEQKREILSVFVGYLVARGVNINDVDNLKIELKKLLKENTSFISREFQTTSELSFEEFKYKLNQWLAKTDNSMLDKDFEPIKEIFLKRNIENTISDFDNQNFKRYIDFPKNKFKFYVNKKIDKIRSLSPKEFKGKVVKIAAGTLIFSALFSSIVGVAGFNFGIDYQIENQKNNVCVEYEIQYGDTMDMLRDTYELRDIGISHLEIKGYDRQTLTYSLGMDINDLLVEGDVIVARGTKENIDKLVARGGRIISAAEAVKLLSETGSLTGQFKEFADGESEFVFFEPKNHMSL